MEQARPSLLPMATWVMFLIPFAVGYPWFIDYALGRYGVRAVAVAALAMGSVNVLLSWRRSRRSDHPKLVLAAQFCGLALTACAAVLPARWPLLLVPGIIQLFLAVIFWQSLSVGYSMIERAARLIEPHAPVWISGYCRTVTFVWGVFFLINAVLVVVLVISGSEQLWARYSGGGLCLAAFALHGVETVVRKIWFRNYGTSLIDQIFRRFFPPEKTERGRRSMAYIRKMRQQLGMEMPP